MRRVYLIGILFTALSFASSVQLSAQAADSNNGPYPLIPNGATAYDSTNGVTWLVDADLAASADANSAGDKLTSDDAPPRFGLPLCNADSTSECIWADGTMTTRRHRNGSYA